MYIKVLLCVVFLFVLTISASAVASYRVVFNNGETVEAESYTMKGGTITLKYKTGKASFPKDLVKSITKKSGKVKLLSEPGKKLPKQKSTADTKPISAGTVFKAVTGIDRRPEAGKSATKENTRPGAANPEFYEGMWPEEEDFWKGK